MYSLRRTLAVRFSLTLFGALLIIALWAYFGAQRLLREELDRDLLATAEMELGLVRTGFPIHPYPVDLTRHQFIEQINRFVAVRPTPDTVLAANTAHARDLPVDVEAFAQAVAGANVWTTEEWGDDAVRSLYMPVPGPEGRAPWVIQVAASLDIHRAASRELLLLMLGTVLLGTLATGIGANWLAASIVEPVHMIASQARAIMPTEKSRRITAHADVTELQGLVRVLNEMLERLDAAFEGQRRMIADAGHDLRTPLTAMRGELEVTLRSERSAASYQSVIESQLEEVDHLIAVSESLILLARLDAGELTPSLRQTDLVDVLRAAADRARARAGARTILTDAVQPVVVNVDPSLMAIAFNHLLDNGIDHTPDGSEIRVAVRKNGWALVSVEDDGPGIPQNELPYMFERFYRSDEARTRGGGPGLGLSIAAAVVRMNGGTIRAEASPSGGLAIIVELPTT